MTIESAPRHDSRSNLSQHSSDEKFTQPEGCGYQKHNNNPIFGDNSIVIIINVPAANAAGMRKTKVNADIVSSRKRFARCKKPAPFVDMDKKKE